MHSKWHLDQHVQNYENDVFIDKQISSEFIYVCLNIF